MNKSRLKNRITYFLLALFLSMEVIGMHALMHDNDHDDADCSICVVTNFNKSNPALTPDNPEFSIKIAEIVIATRVLDSYVYISSKMVATSQLVPRPPPGYLI